MYIQPNSKVYICAGVPLDERFDDTYIFDSADQQIYYINNYYIKTFDKYSYQRIKKNSIKVEAKADDLYGANYMTFQNTAYGSKWFFAFIRQVNYINDNVSEVVYEIDPIQTWMFEWRLGQCFIERHHAFGDAVGQNRVPENLDFGELEVASMDIPSTLDDLSVVVFTTFEENGGVYTKASGDYINSKYYSGLVPHDFPLTPTGITNLKSFIDNVPANMIDGLLTAVLMPTALITHSGNNPFFATFNIPRNSTVYRYDNNMNLVQVHNNKCLIYPYNYLYVTNFNGKTAQYRYEDFEILLNNDGCYFNVFGDRTPNPSVGIVPLYYNMKATQSNYENYEYRLVLDGYPQIAYNTDAYKIWLSQNLGNIGMTALSSAFYGSLAGVTSGASSLPGLSEGSGGALAGAMAGGLLGGIPGAVLGGIVGSSGAAIARLLGGGVTAAMKPPQSNGTQGGCLLSQMGLLNFGFINMRMKPEFATIIDNYFDMFGYAQHNLGVPNPRIRESWTYIKTVGCVVEGNIPADDVKKIKDIFDAGIRFWRQTKTIGDYTQSNSPVVPTP